jgi:hypothetical protein
MRLTNSASTGSSFSSLRLICLPVSSLLFFTFHSYKPQSLSNLRTLITVTIPGHWNWL